MKKSMRHLWEKRRLAAGVFALMLLMLAVPTKPVMAAEKMQLKDFYYYLSNGEEWSFMEKESNSGTIGQMAKGEKTYRGIKIGDSANKVMKQYGKIKKKKFNQSDSFNKFLNYYKEKYMVDTTGWKYFLEYSYKKGTKNDRRLRFYLNKKNKVVDIVYIQKLKAFKINDKTLDIDFGFASDSEKITTKKISGNNVYMIPQDAVVSYDNDKLPKDIMGYPYGVSFNIEQINARGKVTAFSYLPMGVNQVKVDKEMSPILKENMYQIKHNSYHFLNMDTTKLGKYKYFKLTIYDSEGEDGYDMPAVHYFKYK